MAAEKLGRGPIAYKELSSVPTTYKAANGDYEFNFNYRNLKIIVVGGVLVFSLNGPDENNIDGKVIAGQELTLEDIDIHRLSIKKDSGTITLMRFWAYK